MPRPKKRGGRSGRGKSRNAVQESSASGTSAGMCFDPGLFGGEDLIYGSNLDVFEEVTISIDDEPINVENSRSNTPNSAFDSCSNENSLSSLATTESLTTKFWTREEDLTPSAVLPDNLFTDEEMKSFSLDQTDGGFGIQENADFSIASLFSVKEEPVDTVKIKQEQSDESKKATRRRVKVELPETTEKVLRPLSSYEEHVLYRKLHQLHEKSSMSAEQRRLYRKLCLRNVKRSLGTEPFNFDRLVARLSGQEWTQETNVQETRSLIVNVLDRFQKGPMQISNVNLRMNVSFRARLVGNEDHVPQPFVSPYTGRTLKPFIRRDYESKPLKLKLMEEIRKRNPEARNSPPKPIDFCYVRPHHIAAVSAMCREFFWSGIDLTECLEYPDFSCVVLYGHLIVGFAFMVPDVSYNEAYISYIFTHPEWRGAGIATFMLYHLIQSCMGKDVTLHVSATNPALNLYHKFGFKVEEFVQDFYDKYFPPESTQCKHAFFMRLTR